MLTGTPGDDCRFIPVDLLRPAPVNIAFPVCRGVIALLCSWVVAILFSPLTGRGCYLTTSDRRRKVPDGWPADTSGYCARRCVTASPPCVLPSLCLVCPFTEQPFAGGVFPRLRQARIAGKPDATGKMPRSRKRKIGLKSWEGSADNRNVERFFDIRWSGAIRFTCLWMCFWQMKYRPDGGGG